MVPKIVNLKNVRLSTGSWWVYKLLFGDVYTIIERTYRLLVGICPLLMGVYRLLIRGLYTCEML